MLHKKFALLASTALTVAAAGAVHAQSSAASCDGLLERVEALPQELPEGVGWTIEDVRNAAESADIERCAIIVADIDRMMQDSASDSDTATAKAEADASDTMRAVETAQTRVTLQDEAVVEGTVFIDREAANVEVSEGQTEIMVTPGQQNVTVNEQAAQITVREQPARITVEMAQPTIRIEQPAPEIIITMPEPGVDVADAEPQIEVRQAEPTVTVTQASPSVDLELQVAENPDESRGIEVEDRATGERFAMGETRDMPSEDANVSIARSEPIVHMQRADGSQPQISVNRAEPTLNYERAEPEVSFSQTGEPSVEFAQAGEPRVTIRRAGEGDESQQASAEGATPGNRATDAEAEDAELAEAENVEMAAEAAGREVEEEATELAAEADAATDGRPEAEEVRMTDTAGNATGGTMTGGETEMADSGAREGNATAGARDGMTAVDLSALTMDDLDGAPLYGANDERIGEVAQGVLADDGLRISGVVLEVGGFLGLGEHEVMMELENIQFVRSDMGGEIRAYVNATQEELEAMPEWDN